MQSMLHLSGLKKPYLSSLPAGDLLVTVPERLLISTSSARLSPDFACRLEAAGPLTDLQVGQSVSGEAWYFTQAGRTSHSNPMKDYVAADTCSIPYIRAFKGRPLILGSLPADPAERIYIPVILPSR